MTTSDHVKTPAMIGLTLILALAAFDAVLLLQTLTAYRTQEREARTALRIGEPLDDSLHEQERRLHEPGRDEKGRVVAIPIEEAMKLVVASAGNDATRQH